MIGIITLYYNNYNIGGLLQAYALQKTLEDNGIESEQLSVWHYKKETVSFSRKITRHPLHRNFYRMPASLLQHRIIQK